VPVVHRLLLELRLLEDITKLNVEVVMEDAGTLGSSQDPKKKEQELAEARKNRQERLGHEVHDADTTPEDARRARSERLGHEIFEDEQKDESPSPAIPGPDTDPPEVADPPQPTDPAS
jgi:hypothetical protein